LWKPQLLQLVKMTSKTTWGLSLASEVGCSQGLSSHPLGSEATSRYVLSELKSVIEHSVGIPCRINCSLCVLCISHILGSQESSVLIVK
jgi:hypothetical protein